MLRAESKVQLWGGNQRCGRRREKKERWGEGQVFIPTVGRPLGIDLACEMLVDPELRGSRSIVEEDYGRG